MILLAAQLDDMADADRATVGVTARGWLPLACVPRFKLTVAIHFFNLLQTQPLQFVYCEKREYGSEDQDASKDKHDERVVLCGDFVGEEGEQEVPEPVGGTAKTDALGT